MLLNVYNRFNVNFVKGKGVYLYDDQGNEFLDFVSGIAVNCLGHAHPVISEALRKQGETLIHISNLYHSEAQTKLVDKLIGLSKHENVFFSNSGTEANELAIKIARKFGNNINNNKTEIIYMKDSFHGRSTGSLAVTGQKKYQEPFEPLIPNVTECLFNNIEDFISKINENTCAVILEPVQGESGIQTASPEFLKVLKEKCEEYNALLIFDEIQCGMGRMGTLFAYDKLGVVPDIVTIAKALGGGVPIGACLTRGKANDVMVPGDHGSTYGGNPLVCAVAYDVLTELVDNKVIAGVEEKGKYVSEKLNALKEKYDLIEEIRGTGLLIGIKLNERVAAREFANKAFDNKFLLVPAGNNVLRYFPPLNVTFEEIDKSIIKIEEVLKEI
ncbi:MAG: aspartate aminotransferase family protein [Sebaldella sp.]|nr:aspartate aminotransferase family protein [Sebaldella sp.]